MAVDSIIGVVSEGHADRAVITNILKGALGIDESNIRALLPINKTDATDRSIPKRAEEFGSWTSVKNECIEKKIISQFLALEGQDYIVIHMDTAEASQYGLKSIPPKDQDYADTLRNSMVELIDSWLSEEKVINGTLHAIAIEETDAWLLTIYEPGKDSTSSADPKKKLGFILSKNNINSTSDYDSYLKLSKSFSKKRDMNRFKYPDQNASLKAFINEIANKIK